MFFTAFSLTCLVSLAMGQFALPNIQPEPPKATVPNGLESYFAVQPQLANLLNPVWQGVVPDKTFNFADSAGGIIPSGIDTSQQTTANGAGNLAHSNFGSIVPGLFGPLSNAIKGSTPNGNTLGGTKNGSSILGIPNIFPSLPNAPLTSLTGGQQQQQQQSPLAGFQGVGNSGGLFGAGLTNFLAANGFKPQPVHPQTSRFPNIGSVGNIGSFFPGVGGQGLPPALTSGPLGPALNALLGGAGGPQGSGTGAFQTEEGGNGTGNGVGGGKILTQVIESLGKNILSSVASQRQQAVPSLGPAQTLDPSALNSILAQGQSGPGDVLSTVLFSALTDSNSVIRNLGNKSLAKDGKSLKANAALLQQLFTQASSPLCNPKPEPVEDFDLRAFMGRYYQTIENGPVSTTKTLQIPVNKNVTVVYSPPMSLGPCSMIQFTDVGVGGIASGGAGSIFNLFEYTTEGTPNGRPQISSGYAMVRAPGQLVFHTSSNPTPLNVFVLRTGPRNELGQYAYVVLSINCNYPVYVYARDPVEFKQMYEAEVTEMLGERGLASTWARLFNIISPVDTNLCNFPPTVFNT